MAIYHCSVKNISRSSGRSSVAASAYRSGDKLTNDRDGTVHDYRRRSGVEHSEIILPANAPEEYRDRETLWNSVERTEVRVNSRTAREIEIALPVDFDRQSQIDIIRKYINDNFVSCGMCADLSIHDKRDGNPHAHIMLTTREVSPEGFTVKNREWNKTERLEQWRKSWADICNREFERQNIPERIDHRTLQAQGIEREPTIHMGPAATQMEKRDQHSERGDYNREVKARNHAYQQDIAEVKSEIEAIKAKQSRGVAAPMGATAAAPPKKMSIKDQLAAAKIEADRRNAEKKTMNIPRKRHGPDR